MYPPHDELFASMPSGLNDPDLSSRLDCLRQAAFTASGTEVNNHVHSWYSFSPYSPSAAAYMARMSGLAVVGLMDHDSVAGAEEMLAACRIAGIASTIGFELRTFFPDDFRLRKINNPDSCGIAYIAVHGIPETAFSQSAQFLKPLHRAREKRNRRMTAKLNSLLGQNDFLHLNYDYDVITASRALEGGSVTERHILMALSQKMIKFAGRGKTLAAFYSDRMGMELSASQRSLLSDEKNPYLAYDLLGFLKSAYLQGFYIQPEKDECPDVRDAVDFALSINAIPAYAYLGDVGASPTGDKKAEQFEDGFLDELFSLLKKTGFRAVTYMPPRNTPGQIAGIRRLCTENGMMEISGVDVNSPRQEFTCPSVMSREFMHLQDASWALVAHEKMCAVDAESGIFTDAAGAGEKTLMEKIKVFGSLGREMDVNGSFDAAELKMKLKAGLAAV